MASPTQAREGLTLEEFLRLPEEKPYLEFIDGRIVAKASAQNQHGAIQAELVTFLNEFARRTKLGRAFVELRRTFGGRSIVPDIVFQRTENTPLDRRGRIANESYQTPDIHVEILSPRQSLKKSREKLAHSTAHGCPLGWLIDPGRETVKVSRPSQPVERLAVGDVLLGDPVLPGLRLALAEIFGWLEP
ncbi:MAG TPA: Uma2 family endonuclease [Isosphaeraceae bacterium]|jgi:Uma2 family endonuclease|nr:Uma2 family endonuclease [Isosphaeraceae bacterium]